MKRAYLAVWLLAFGCGARPPAAEQAQSVAVKLEARASLSGERLTIEGTADLPDGANIDYEIVPANFHAGFPADKTHAQGQTLVASGAYRASVNLQGWPRDDLKVWIGFQSVPGLQPQHVLEKYGENGSNLRGKNVKQTKAQRRVEFEAVVRRN